MGQFIDLELDINLLKLPPKMASDLYDTEQPIEVPDNLDNDFLDIYERIRGDENRAKFLIEYDRAEDRGAFIQNRRRL